MLFWMYFIYVLLMVIRMCVGIVLMKWVSVFGLMMVEVGLLGLYMKISWVWLVIVVSMV